MAYYQQPCDSYFVESHGERRFREEMKERQMRAKLQQQHASAEGLSQLASREYREDVLQHMELMEVTELEAQVS